MTTLTELRARVQGPEWQAVDRTDQLVRSIAQSLRAAGHKVTDDEVAKTVADVRGTQEHRMEKQ